MHRPALHQWRSLDDTVILDPLREALEERPAELRMGHLASAELDRDLESIAVLQELDRPMDLGVEVADPDLRAKANLLELDRSRAPLRFLVPFGQLVLVLTIVEEADDGRGGHGSDLDEVETAILRHGECLGCGHDTQLVPVLIDDPNIRYPDHLVDAQVSAYG